MRKTIILTLLSLFLPATLLAGKPEISPQSEGPTKKLSIKKDIQPIGKSLIKEENSSLPKAIVYAMNGNWSQYVPVTLSKDGLSLISFPAPGDVKGQAPVSVGDGLWLDKRGINPESAFTRWTYAEYSALDKAPTPDEILANIIPGAQITEIIALPITSSEAISDPGIVRHMVADGLKGATIRYRLPGGGERINYGEPGPKPMLLTNPTVCSEGSEEPVCH